MLRTTDELIENALFEAGEKTDGTSQFQNRMMPWINRAYRNVWMGGNEFVQQANPKWKWLRFQNHLLLDPAVKGECTTLNGSVNVTLDDPPAVSFVGRHFRVEGHPDIFFVKTHQAGTTAVTLDSVYTGTTGGFKYRAMKLDYDLAIDVLSVTSPMTMSRLPYRVIGISTDLLSERWPLRSLSGGPPHEFALLSRNTVRFSHYGLEMDATYTGDLDWIRVEYTYMQRPDDLAGGANEEPLVPEHFRSILSDMVAYWIMFKKSDERRTELISRARAGVNAMVLEYLVQAPRIGEPAHLFPRQNQVRDYRSGPLRTESGKIIG